ncbi:hypothetical protein GCM10010517_40140 [Streptosporangium fragile]|uniref:DUF397 domain-containing protein n=1 Tax=Streptosporangium fragile TaxID=46186 RepID=A0ABN3W080_9ACTN
MPPGGKQFPMTRDGLGPTLNNCPGRVGLRRTRVSRAQRRKEGLEFYSPVGDTEAIVGRFAAAHSGTTIEE